MKSVGIRSVQEYFLSIIYVYSQSVLLRPLFNVTVSCHIFDYPPHSLRFTSFYSIKLIVCCG